MAPTPPTTDPQALARARREAKRRRTNRIRKSVAAATLTLFVAFFSTIYAQMASGNDPSLSSTTKKTATAVATSSRKAKATSSSSSGSTTTSTSSSGSTSSSPSPVTTQQS
jgi:Na+/H+ antiporter NhaD/arsenite permease-like protein